MAYELLEELPLKTGGLAIVNIKPNIRGPIQDYEVIVLDGLGRGTFYIKGTRQHLLETLNLA